jgi:hypothetical protein
MSNLNNPFNWLIFPHLRTKKQRKEIYSIFCYNIRLVKPVKEDQDYVDYVKSLKKFINENKHLLVQWNDVPDNDRLYRKYFMHQSDEKSVYWDIKHIEPEEKRELDNFLEMTGYKKKIDRFGYIFEGCLNDDKLFVGGKSELVKDYCRLFPNTTYCKQFKVKNESDIIDKVSKAVLDDPHVLDQLAERWLKNMESDGNK